MNKNKLILMSIRELQFGMLQYRRAMFVTLFLLLWFNNQLYGDFVQNEYNEPTLLL